MEGKLDIGELFEKAKETKENFQAKGAEFVSNVADGLHEAFASIRKSKEEDQMDSYDFTSGTVEHQDISDRSSISLPLADARTLSERIKSHPSLYDDFERAFWADVKVQTYLDAPLYDAYSKAFFALCEPLLKFVGFSHYGGSLDDKVWRDGLEAAAEELERVRKRVREQDLRKAYDEREKWEWKLKFKLSLKCTQLLLDLIACSNNQLDDWDKEKALRLNVLMRPDSPGGSENDPFEVWRECLELQNSGFSGKKMEEMYQRLSVVIQKFIKVEISSEQDKKQCAYATFGASVKKYLDDNGKSIGVELHFFEDAEVQESEMRLHFYDSQLKHPGLFKVNGECVLEGGYPRQ